MDYVHRVGGSLRLFVLSEMAPLTVKDRAVSGCSENGNED